MKFNNHSQLTGQHAFLSPSNYAWVNYTDEHLDDRFINHMTAARGSELHALADKLIKLQVKLPGNGKTLSLYVNDAIGYRMQSEQTLFYSFNCFGTVDAISFRRNLLRIHDLKNGVTPAKVTQLEVYAALFCLEYGIKPNAIDIEMRIYQNDTFEAYIGDPNVIFHMIEKIVSFDKRINKLREEAQA